MKRIFVVVPALVFLGSVPGFGRWSLTDERAAADRERTRAADAGWDKVRIEEGYISGGVNSSGDVHFFKGIPFAAPPVGTLRWREPRPAAHWDGVRTCTQFGPSPMQNKPEPFLMWTEEYLIPEKAISEDCLYLNVWTAAGTAKERRPVLVYIYGGGFTSGGGNVPIYDGEAIAKKGVVYVTINYRVGLFGFFSHPDLSRESEHRASGNYGLMDQIAALKWIRSNIAAFGGDPENVTIAGQSAGSMSVNCLVASPLAAGLFEKAIGESGANFSRENLSLAAAETEGQKLALSLGAGTLDSLRSVPAETLLKKGVDFRGPVIDGYVIPEPIADIFLEKKENRVALLTGWNEDEGFVFGPGNSAANYKKDVAKQYGADSETVLRYYPAGNGSADDDSIASVSQVKLSRDLIFGRQNYVWAGIVAAQGQKVYVYRFVRKPPTAPGGKKWGAFHTAEVPYAYDNLRFVRRPFEPADYNLSDEMSSYFVNFARTGDPNGAGLPHWEPFSRASGKIMIFGRQAVAGVLPDKAALEWWYERMMKN
ncbi:MAG TPA: carboxylesterase family protein [Puia sp.]|jgi:para-nitrobenzyl esterase|nr:carboxylesterase family protein [Puia sp.]